LDVVLAALSGAGRADVQRAIAAGRVTVDGEVRPKSFRLTGGETLEADLGQSDIEPEGPPVPVRFRDPYLMVVAKPAGLVAHPTKGRTTGTLVNRLLGMGVNLPTVDDPLRPGIVHRLDVGTSGLMVVALTEESREALSAMFKAHAADRTYLALVRGAPEHDDFVVDAPLGRRADRTVIDRTEGREAETAFHVRERLPRAALLEASPRTGRTHQIRAHLRGIGHPILGDRSYGGGGDDAGALGLSRPFLHSWRIAFDHPLTGERIELEEPLPEDLQDALERARASA
jgi:23S rRNA pseudouridine1911/1915/1917 synthase